MSPISAEFLSSLFSLPQGITLEAVHSAKTCLTVSISCTYPSMPCPLCQHPSERLHGSYKRTIADIPFGGRRVLLSLAVRKFVCRTHTCPRKIFTERLPDLVQSYARLTNRLRDVLQELGFATCGEVGARLAPKLGMYVTPSTLLRHIRACTYTPPEVVKIVGIDDWAWKKGQTYGTILVDLERHCPIELLPDRSVETVEAWLRIHPEVEIISRDRGGDYAAAARKGAPQAQQVADRFHLLKNLREGIKDLMERKQSCLPEADEKVSDAIPQKALGMHTSDIQQAQEAEKHYRVIPPSPYQRPIVSLNYNEFHKQIRRYNRQERYQAVQTLYTQGFSTRTIAQKLGLSRETVSKFVQAETFPERMASSKRASLLDSYKPYLLQRWKEGYRNSVQLYAEITARGYTGSSPLLRIFLADLRKKHQQAGGPTALTLNTDGNAVEIPPGHPSPPRIMHRLSPTRASWLLVSKSEKLSEKQQRQVERIREGHPDLEVAYQLSQGFVSMLTERRDKDVDVWLVQAEQSGLVELKRFANGIRRDYAAVKAAFSSEISNGQVEGQVHRLKLQKRQVYGRANFDLLRLRVMHRV